MSVIICSIYNVTVHEMTASYLSAGLTTFDMADHYGPAEDFYGAFLKQVP